jgi:hypothetical protein
LDKQNRHDLVHHRRQRAIDAMRYCTKHASLRMLATHRRES